MPPPPRITPGARMALGTGRINLYGRTPNGHESIANPRRVWLVKSSRAIIRGVDVGARVRSTKRHGSVIL
jgi:hypothetical protein